MSAPTDPPSRVDLTSEPDFEVGALRLSPSTGRASANGKEERVEPKVMEVLVVLARAGGRTVSRDQLVEACWEGRVVSEDAISRTIAKLRQLARMWEPAPFSVETVPKLGFRLIAAKTADAAPEETGAPSEAASRNRKQNWLPLILGAAGLAVAMLAAWALWPRGPAPFNPSIEVTAFKPLHEDAELSVLGARAATTITGLLTRGGHRAREAAAGGEPATYRIGGIVDRADGAYTLTGQVIHVDSGQVLLSTEARRPEADVTGIDGEVGYALVGALGCAVDERRHSPQTISEDVFGLLLSSCGAGIFGTADPLVSARRLIEAAPGFSGGHGQLALIAAFMTTITNQDPALGKTLLEESRVAADEAERLDPTTAKPYVARALALGQTGAWQEREALLRQASETRRQFFLVQLNYSQMLRETGRLRAAQENASRAADNIDPRIVGALPIAAFLNAMHGDITRAYEIIDMLDTIYPSLGRNVRWTVGYWWDPAATFASVREVYDSSPAHLACFEAAWEQARNGGGGAKGLHPSCATVQPDWRIRMLARQGETDGAYQEFEKTMGTSLRTMMFVFYPEMKAFRHDPRFMPLMKKVGLVDFWRQSGNWPDFCSEPDLPYDCQAFAG